MYICLNCKELFEEPGTWVETHGLDCGPYEEWYGCPYCNGSYAKAYRCDSCGEWIEGKYVKVDDKRYCDYCYEECEPGDERQY